MQLRLYLPHLHVQKSPSTIIAHESVLIMDKDKDELVESKFVMEGC